MKKKLQFYSDWSPLKKAFYGLFRRPVGSVKDALELNKDFLEKFYNDPEVKKIIEKQNEKK